MGWLAISLRTRPGEEDLLTMKSMLCYEWVSMMSRMNGGTVLHRNTHNRNITWRQVFAQREVAYNSQNGILQASRVADQTENAEGRLLQLAEAGLWGRGRHHRA